MASRPPFASNMTDRIKRLLLDPRAEWARIDAEPMTVGDIIRGWVVPLAAIGPVAGLIRGLLFGYGAFGVTYRPSIGSAVVQAVIGYGMAIAGVFVLAWVIDLLATSFGAVPNRVQATKVAAFSATAGFLAGIFQFVPGLGFLGLLGLYSLYLLWIGLPMLMRAPADKGPTYVVVASLAAIVLLAVISALTGQVAALVSEPAGVFDTPGGSITIRG